MSGFLFLIFLLALPMVVSGGYVFYAACVRKKELTWLVEEEVKKTPYAKYYKHMVAADQWLSDHRAQDVSVQSADGLRLYGRWIPTKDPKATIILMHGYRSSILVDFGMVLEHYHSLGMNLLIPDQRSHGKSQGKFITFGVKESGDVRRWIDFHNRNLGSYQVIISGLSMGASTVMYLADEDLPDNVKGFIVDCGFTSPKAILTEVFKRVTHLPAGPSIWVANIFARIFAGFSLTQKDSRVTLSKNKLPILMVHGTEDGFVPCEMTKQSYAACAGPKEMFLVEGADHGVSFLVDKDTYISKVNAFLKMSLEGF